MCECCGGDCKLCDPLPLTAQTCRVCKFHFWGSDDLCYVCMVGGINPELLGPMSGECDQCNEHTMDCNCMRVQELLAEYDKIADTFDGFTRLMRKKFPLERIEGEKKLPEYMIDQIKSIGKAQAKLKNILDNDLFDSLSKHDPYWTSEDPDTEDQLQVLRMKLTCISDDLWDLWAILRKEDEEL